MWGSYDMALIVKSKNNKAVICVYEDAGHSFEGNGVVNQPGMGMRLGGNEEGK